MLRTWWPFVVALGWTLGVLIVAGQEPEPFVERMPQWFPILSWTMAYAAAAAALIAAVWGNVRGRPLQLLEPPVLFLSALLCGGCAVAVELTVLRDLHTIVLASGLAKVGIASRGRIEVLEGLLTKGAGWLAIGVLGFTIWRWGAPSGEGGSHRRRLLVIAAGLGVAGLLAIASPGLTYLAALGDAATGVDSWEPPAMGAPRSSAELDRARLRFLLGIVVAGASWSASSALFIVVLRNSIRDWSGRAFAGLIAAILLLAGVMIGRTRALAAENASPVPVEYAFANLTLGFPPDPAIEGRGPDAPRDTPVLEIRDWRVDPSSRRIPVPEQRADGRDRRDARSSRSLGISVHEAVPVMVLREWLTRVNQAGYGEVDLQMTSALRRVTPLFGELTGVHWSAVKVRLAAQDGDCPNGAAPIFMHPPRESACGSWVRSLGTERRAGRELCAVVGHPVCQTEGRAQRECLERLRAPAEPIQRVRLKPDVVAVRFSSAGRGFDALLTSAPGDIEVSQPPLATGGTVAQRVGELKNLSREVFLVMNAGMYHPGYGPVGLLVSGGQLHHGLEESSGEGNFFLLPNGVFTVSADRTRVKVSATSAVAEELVILEEGGVPRRMPYSEATQSGPLLLRHGQQHPSIDPKSSSRFVRNAVGTQGEHTTVFLISREPVTFYETARALTVMGSADGLYLDGHISNAYLPALGRSADERPLGPLISVRRAPDGDRR